MERRERHAWRAVAVAALLIFASIEPGTARAVSPVSDDLEATKSDIRLKKFSAAAGELQRLAVTGNLEAQYLLAAFYLNGLSGPRDPVAARNWLEKSAQQGNARAAFSLSVLLRDSDPPDQEGARRWLSRAHELGFMEPQQLVARDTQSPEPGSSVDRADSRTRSEALWLAAQRGDLESLQALTASPFVDPPDEFGRGALARAAAAGKAQAVAFLIRRGASIDATDLHGTTPLMLAAQIGRAHV